MMYTDGVKSSKQRLSVYPSHALANIYRPMSCPVIFIDGVRLATTNLRDVGARWMKGLRVLHVCNHILQVIIQA